jgi:hypothetical protein
VFADCLEVVGTQFRVIDIEQCLFDLLGSELDSSQHDTKVVCATNI